MSDAPFLRLRAVSRRYRVGGQEVNALRAIDLDIQSGEMIALVGASGSGKSTLMNILGCLDRPNSGTYSVAGRDTSGLDPDETAALRCAYFGFVFQRYHLLSQLTARDNVEIPAVYTGAGAEERHARATELLTCLGLGERLEHLPNELSGGQQQRVSIARALMNGGAVILADEPTGALDSATGEEMMTILLELNAQGHTLIIATHDHQVAGHAKRIIEMADGVIVSDRAVGHEAGPASPAPSIATIRPSPWTRYGEAARMAFLSLRAHRLRTALTALGVIIGVFAVIMTVALGESAQRSLEQSLAALGTKTFEIEPGQEIGDPRAERVQTLTVQDLDGLRRQPYVRSASPRQTTSSLLRYRSMSGLATIWGVGESYFDAKSLAIVRGVAFDAEDETRQAQVVVIDENVQRQFFASESPLGKTVYIGNLPCMIIGVVGHLEGRLNQTLENGLNVWAPFSVVSTRLTGRRYLKNIFLRLHADQSVAAAESAMTQLLLERHRYKGLRRLELGRATQDDRSSRPSHVARLRRDRRDLARRGRRRGDEHHAGVGSGARQGDRHTHRRRRAALRYPRSVSDRGRRRLPARRRGRRRNLRRHRRHPRMAVAERFRIRAVRSRHRHRRRLRGADRRRRRLCTGAQGGAARSRGGPRP